MTKKTRSHLPHTHTHTHTKTPRITATIFLIPTEGGQTGATRNGSDILIVTTPWQAGRRERREIVQSPLLTAFQGRELREAKKKLSLGSTHKKSRLLAQHNDQATPEIH